jgi:Mg2+ and Co2+ transporter CorA
MKPTKSNIFSGASYGKTIYDNTETDEIRINPSKLKEKVTELNEAQNHKNAAIGAISFAAMAFFALVTADFKDRFNTPGSTWQALAMFILLFGLICAAVCWYKYWKSPIKTPKDCIESMKKDGREGRVY